VSAALHAVGGVGDVKLTAIAEAIPCGSSSLCHSTSPSWLVTLGLWCC
jgi:hypothetical protein